MTAYEARTGQTVAVEDAKLRGTQAVAFEVASGDDVRVTLTLEYELKQTQRRSHRCSTRCSSAARCASRCDRTLARFGHERRAEIELITRS